jgi:hypothetical protein
MEVHKAKSVNFNPAIISLSNEYFLHLDRLSLHKIFIPFKSFL